MTSPAAVITFIAWNAPISGRRTRIGLPQASTSTSCPRSSSRRPVIFSSAPTGILGHADDLGAARLHSSATRRP
jgi:hypothetical protein